MHTRQRFAGAFAEDYCVSFVEVRITSIVEDVTSSKFLAANSRLTYVRYIRAGKNIFKHKGVLLFLLKLGKNGPVVATLVTTSLDNAFPYISSGKKIILMSQAANELLKNNQKPVFLYAILFSRQYQAFLVKLYIRPLEFDKEKLSTFLQLLDTKIHQTIIISH